MTVYLETVSGNLVDVQNPDPATISIEDIAWGLSRMPRFAGHTITIVPYSVAQHCIFVADEIERLLLNDTPPFHMSMNVWEEWVYGDMKDDTLRRFKLLGQLHDASEIYTGDLPSPIKQIPELRPVIKQIEHGLMTAVYEAMKIHKPSDDEEKLIKYADKIAQRIEAHAFMPSRGKNWPGLPDVSFEQLQSFGAPLPALDAYKLFMQRFKSLNNSQE